METRAWVGANLGRSISTPGAYNVWVPSETKVVLTSEVYFSETSFPWKQASSPDSNPAQPADGNASQPPGLPTTEPGADSPKLRVPPVHLESSDSSASASRK
eukprot:4104130-Pleurochrysis_carterae.AAC.1